MRKRLTAKLFKRLSLVALVVSLVGWGVSEFLFAFVCLSNVEFIVMRGAIEFTYDTSNDLIVREFDGVFFWLDRPGFSLPTPKFGRILGSPFPWGHFIGFSIPFWLLSLIALATFLFFRRIDRRSAIAPGCCVHCGYDASKCTDNRCSECGEPLAVEAAAAG